ncbi:MAG: urea carboxylase [Planctomycetota bacterium]
MFKKVLIANRGEIACRVIRTLKRLGVKSVAVYSEPDIHSGHVAAADEAVCIGPAAASESYLRGEKILEAAKATGAEAIHPGYGFLSENPAFADACAEAGIVFIGPTGESMRAFGLKHTARELAHANGVPMLTGSSLLSDLAHADREAERIGYPVMLKATAGGGGIGMRVCRKPEELAGQLAIVERLSKANFKESGIYLEKFVPVGRHIEVQIFGDGEGNVIALGERDCSVQRRNQKVIEETPAPNITEATRQSLFSAATKLAAAVKYQSAGTVEFIYDASQEKAYFLEVNTRLQVEHTVTEEVTGYDLVEWMLKQAAGELPPLESLRVEPSGASIQVRLYAEDPNKNFQPSSGRLTGVTFSKNARIETWVEPGSDISPHYDPLVAKIISKGRDRSEAIANLKAALAESAVYGIETNLSYLRQILDDARFVSGDVSTGLLSTFNYTPATIDVLDGGAHSTVQDYPGRIGYWDIGVPPSGPMDALSFRLANRIVGNADEAAGFEFTLNGPTLKFNIDATVALAGAEMKATLDGKPVAYYSPIDIKRGQTLKLGPISGPGFRTALAVRNGVDVPKYLNSRATFTLGNFGGHAGRCLRTGDVVAINTSSTSDDSIPKALVPELIPELTHNWDVRVLYGPHGAPDFFTPDDIDMLFSTAWKIHYNSNRTGVRLIGPKPKWARTDGGEAGLHPSNIHDNAYAIGTLDFTGDMPVILGPDGPSLGGFVCPATIIQADLWKLGQFKPGDTLRIHPVTVEDANRLEREQDAGVASLVASSTPPIVNLSANIADFSPILHTLPPTAQRPGVVYRLDGDKYLLIEYGPLVLDLNLRFRVHALVEWLRQNHIPGIIDLTPGIRSLHIHYDSRILPLKMLLADLIAAEDKLPAIEDMEVPTRIVHMPLSWDDVATRKAIDIYMKSVRADAPWCPWNIEFIRRINGLQSVEQVKNIVFNASYLVLGLGDVYLGAPVATPVDPRHRLVTTKYNPARTWTAENSVGIGGAYMCVYGMEGPGGYQFVGRTVQVWNTHKSTADFTPGTPWLLRFFDQIRFYPVSAEQLLQHREDFLQGKFKLKITEETFSLKNYNAFLTENRESITAFKSTQQSAFEAERDDWKRTGKLTFTSEIDLDTPPVDTQVTVPDGCELVSAGISGNIWKIPVKKGASVKAGDVLVIIEAMKMEISVFAPTDGSIEEIVCSEGKPVTAGQALLVLRA